MIELNKINKIYKNPVITDFSYSFNNEGLFSIFGASGSGKTTLLNIISGLDLNYQGDLTIEGVNISLLKEEERSLFRLKTIGYVFQDFCLIESLSVYDNVLLNLDAISSLSKDSKNKLVKDALKYVNLENKIKITVNKLSGGEKQRVAIARAIVTNPNYLLCDEPTGNLDNKNSEIIFKIIKEYSQNHCVVLVSHDKSNVYKYSDKIILLKDGKINSVVDNSNHKKEEIPKVKIPKKDTPSLSFSLLFRSGINKIKEKKYRFLFTNLISSISLLALGIGIVVSTTLRGQIVDSFASVIDANQVIVSKKTTNPNPYTGYIAADEEDAYNLYQEYEDYTYGMGVNYLNNFNEFFPTTNMVYLENVRGKKSITPSLHAEKFSNYVWKEEKVVDQYYPSLADEISLNDIAIGITYNDLKRICNDFQLGICSFQSLGNYISSNEVTLTFSFANEEWGYTNDYTFKLVAVYPSSQTEILHTNHMFNQYVFEDLCQLPTTYEIEKTPEVPWTLKRVFTLHSVEEPTELIEKVQYNKKYDSIILERTTNYLNDIYDAQILLIFMIDKNAVDISDIIDFKKIESQINNFYLSSQGGYQMHSSGMIAGFSRNVGFSFSEEKIIQIGDAFSKQKEGEIENIEGVAIGGITRYNNNGVLFSSDLSNLKKGEIPTSYDEIVVSTGLIKYLGFTGNPIYEDLMYCMYSNTLDEVIINSFKIVGLVENDDNYIYHYPLFTSSFFRDRLCISSFELIPTSMVLSIDDGADIDLVISKLSSAFKEYEFKCPLNEIGETVDEVMNYVKIIALLFASIALIISFLLTALIAYLNALESKKEIAMLKHIGHSNKVMKNYIVSHTFVSSLVTTSLSLVELFAAQIIMSIILTKTMGGTLIITVKILPFIAVILVGILVPLMLAKLITHIFLKKK